jgi:hypothetical protein
MGYGLQRRVAKRGWEKRDIGMDAIGAALVVGGMAFLFSGLIFLLPHPTGKRPPKAKSEKSDDEPAVQ